MNLFGVSRSGGASSNIQLLKSFAKLVATLRTSKSTCTVVEQSCGGIIASSILMQPGASQVFYGSGVIYNTVQSKPLLVLNNNVDDSLYQSFIDKKPSLLAVELFERSVSSSSNIDIYLDDEMKQYIQSKIDWTRHAAIQYCTTLQTDYAIAEGGAVGPTFRPTNMKCGFSVVAIAGKQQQQQQPTTTTHASNNSTEDDQDASGVTILRQEIIFSPHNNRIENMYSFAQIAADICTSALDDQQQIEPTMDTTEDSIALSNNQKESTSPSLPQTQESGRTQQNPTTDNIDNQKSVKLLDRVTHLRSNTDLLQYLQHTAINTRFILLNSSKQILVHNNNKSNNNFEAIAYLPRHELHQLLLLNEKHIENNQTILSTSFLGLVKDEEHESITTEANDNSMNKDSMNAIFAIDVRAIPESIDKSLKEKYVFVDTRSSLPILPNVVDTDIVLYGTALAEWKRRNKFCFNCGSPNVSFDEGGGTVGHCLQCHTKFWPRQDPSMIVLIVSRDQQRVLLANHVRHKNRMIYTTLAGFVEVGETFENAVAREVFEETGIRVDMSQPIRYIGSQPWPFPQSCMIGFIATADDTNQDILIDKNEIYDAKWFDRSDIIEASKIVGSTLQSNVTEMVMKQNPNLSCVIPPRGVIARQLIDTWLQEQENDGEGGGVYRQSSQFVRTRVI